MMNVNDYEEDNDFIDPKEVHAISMRGDEQANKYFVTLRNGTEREITKGQFELLRQWLLGQI